MDPQLYNSDSDESALDEEILTSDSDEELFDQMDEEWSMAWASIVFVFSTTQEFFSANEMDGQITINPCFGVQDFLASLRATPHMFKCLANLIATEFEELSTLVVPTIANYSRSTRLVHGVGGRPSKMTPQQCLLNFIMFMKHDNTWRYDAFKWNWNLGSVCNDALFIASYINVSIFYEIKWPVPKERRQLATTIPKFPGYIGIVDGTLIKIRRPFNNLEHSRWFNGRKKMYAMNNIVIIDHNGLFIHLDLGYPASFHDVSILRHSDVYKNWRDHFVHEDHYFENLLGDPGYIGKDHFIMRRIGVLEVHPNADVAAITTYNKMHAGYQVKVEWGIGGLKRKWHRLMKQFDSTKPKYCQLFYTVALLTNFLHKRRMDFSCEIVGERHVDEEKFAGMEISSHSSFMASIYWPL